MGNGIHLTMRTQMRSPDLSNYADVIDTRWVIERVEELEAEYAAPEDNWVIDDFNEYKALTGLLAECREIAQYEGHPEDGMTLVRETYMREHVAEYYADTYGNRFKEYDPHQFKDVDVTWDDLTSQLPFSCIDWEKVAEVVESESDSVTYDGVTYYLG
jgi:hypothetical protein